MVVDTSALLAVVFNEPHGDWVTRQFKNHPGELLMSTVNLAETLMILRKRMPTSLSKYESAVLSIDLEFVPPTTDQARIAAEARHRFPLNLGDCFAYALSVTENCPILTLDEDFRRCDRPVVIPPRL
jgi:ribonuclease VapC